ncbi:MAG: tetratricopeptide repeat protein [Actinomycetota bacterium]|nr:tetratricopeptide repeat protein [Actinomycetota bacterium]
MPPGAPRRPAPPAPRLAAGMAGAVDLAAIQARNEAAARAAQAPVPTAGQYVVDVTEATFQTDVLDRSFQVPVLLDLWAEWCEPCKQLSPILERLANESQGSWILAKIDVDANPRISQALQVQSIPTVFAVIGGQLVPGFQGLLPEAQLREFVGAAEQAGREAGLPGVPPAGEGSAAQGFTTEPGAAAGPPTQPEDPRFVAAEDALQDGDYALAAERYQGILAAEPANTEAALALGQVRLLQRLETYDAAVAGRADADPDDLAAQLAAADVAFADNDVDSAFSRLLGLLTRTSGEDRDSVRQRLIEYFDLLGPEDPRVAPARREMARVLF